MLARARHRAHQFFEALRPHVDDADRREAYAVLNDGQRRLFETMMLRDQQHGMAVFHRIRAVYAGDTALQAAALLHDCGKGRVRLWERVAYVLLDAVAPSMLPRIASEHGAGWRRAFWRLYHHPEIGADLVAATGAEADIVRMIREQDAGPHGDARLAALQAADEA